ncbi:lauroyl-Kdo(2)-lipid IV(A) myristoyltransferase [Edwardsiella piscicida]|uniref:lauroyl-Kdo(2)-lipid IV(A) myristoyltransferase n=1 Tax=Edwardsiella piscicida TaxID=1263550 RepID=UPI0009338E21|nr:lauroyl-Kdo(2)-lipid IV(A) myristoyltransferase [Edwardsiella piscicida]EKS7811833.1 lauroyl-Kdo(2)-lipid IV(A) myristoyltransferase [Edwardsiella piscicida]UCQ22388.1 lauroyl-Kdo(2)-lipid IV(A) myristoyltransferase [Edwardsiella piscicida]WAM46038.1 lauroyl-Kdo(2)-lipid IV(A) myristoyltransferase [Edwardsiella piscicida]
MQQETKSNAEFIPRFRAAFLSPRYWGVWLGIALMAAMAFLPLRLRDRMIGAVGRLAGRLASGARRRARINLMLCFPQMDAHRREEIIDTMFARAGQSMFLMAELTLRGPRRLLRHTHWHGGEIIEQARQQGENVIFLVPHGWAVDIPAMLLAAGGQPMAAMFHNQKNPLVDYLWNRARRRFGGRLHARNDGIKPFISSVRKGYWGYYLPDQDHGAEHSEFVDFFATYKATLPAIGRLMKLCRARIIPLFPVYDGVQGRLDIYLRPPMDDIAGQDDAYIARRMNQEVELLMGEHPEQYTWILKLLKTRRPGEIEPYCRQDL